MATAKKSDPAPDDLEALNRRIADEAAAATTAQARSSAAAVTPTDDQ